MSGSAMRLFFCLCFLLALPHLALARDCSASRSSPLIEIRTEQGDPAVTSGQSVKDLDGKSAAGHSYRPSGTEGPQWHTAGLTQSNIKITDEIQSHSLSTQDHSRGCLYIDKVTLHVILSPVVWVADEFPVI